MPSLRRKKISLSKALLLCPLLLGCSSYKRDPAAIQQQISAAIPLNSTPTQVLDYLNHQKIVHSKYHHGDDAGKIIEAEVFVQTNRELVKPSYEVEFHFGDNDRLTSYEVHFLGYIGF